MRGSFDKVAGVGGIGTGMLFHTDDNRTLGRSESRLVTLSGAKDYCKLHIVFHYIAALLPSDRKVYPIGGVGMDGAGERLLLHMARYGMDTSLVRRERDLPTAVSICLQYPDKEGCNFTASNGAGETVTPEYVHDCMDRLGADPRTIAVALPESPLESRLKLLETGRERGSMCILSFAAGEVGFVRESDILRFCDLLSVNQEEAGALLDRLEEGSELARQLYLYAAQANPGITVAVTCGRSGAFIADSGRTEKVGTFPAEPVNTSGAGDAFLGGTIAAIALGYPLKKNTGDKFLGETPLMSAPELGAVCAGIAVGSPDSIAEEVTADHLEGELKRRGIPTKFRFDEMKHEGGADCGRNHL